MAFDPVLARPVGMALGALADALWGDPRRGHPVAAYGRAVQALERRWYADDVRHGLAFTTVAVGTPVLVAVAAERIARRHPATHVLLTAAATWAVLGGTGLAREGRIMARLLEAEDLPGARDRLSHLCARDPAGLGAQALARATVESLAENTSDAVVAPLLWGAVAGVPGVIGYRAVNTLDAMVGYTSPRYRRFGRVSARLDDLVNLVPARVTATLTVATATVVGGSPAQTWRVWRRDGRHHPSPNAGHPEAAAAGALGVRLGGENSYAGRAERRPVLGDGRPVAIADVRRAVRLAQTVGVAAGVLAVVGAAVGCRTGRRGACPRTVAQAPTPISARRRRR